MKRALLCLIAFSAMLAGCMSPKITFDSTSHDFGTVGKKETLVHEFTFRNKGNQTLKIEKIHSG